MDLIWNNKRILTPGGNLHITSNPITPPQETITDYDGNIYDTVTIGTQTWTVQNLKTTHYNDGALIPNISNYNDWFLPSKDELYQMWNQIYTWGFGNFSPQTYWSSSEWYNDTSAWNLDFTNGSEGGYSKSSEHGVRACRSFTGGTYNLRDIGPAGGRIFITGTTYYECAPTDSIISRWSNITTPLTTTGTAIGSGQTNTNLIISQVGHTTSAAKLTDDLTSNILWSRDLYGAMCYYDNDKATYENPYGALYNWYAVNTGKLAPSGWRVPIGSDFTTLKSFLGVNTNSAKLKESGTTHWNTPNTGATDEYGFKALPGSNRDNNGSFGVFGGIGVHGDFIQSDLSGLNAQANILWYDNLVMGVIQGDKTLGYSVRLIKN